MLVLSHPTGNANVREAVRAFSEEGLLSEFWTTVSWQEKPALNRLLPLQVLTELNRRSFPHVQPDQLHTQPWREAGRLLCGRLGLSSLIRHESGPFSVDAVYRGLDRKVAAELPLKSGVTAAYCYEDGALTTFRAARAAGIKAIYELPIGYWKAHRELLEEEAELQPEWAKTLRGKSDSQTKLNRKDEELALADHIIVPSEFVRQTLLKAGAVQTPVSVIPYGAPSPKPKVKKYVNSAAKLKVIFVGMLSQRKGLGYLLEAIEKLGSNVELTLIGKRVGQCNPLDEALAVHRWIPSLSHSAVLQEISQHDVMVFPSLFEGFGLVALEAMSRGVPVIATPQGGAPDFMADGEDGFLVPIRNSEAIADKLELLMQDRDRLTAMSEAAVRKAAQHSWENYRQLLVNTVRQVLTLTDTVNSVRLPWSQELQECDQC